MKNKSRFVIQMNQSFNQSINQCFFLNTQRVRAGGSGRRSPRLLGRARPLIQNKKSDLSPARQLWFLLYFPWVAKQRHGNSNSRPASVKRAPARIAVAPTGAAIGIQ